MCDWNPINNNKVTAEILGIAMFAMEDLDYFV